MLREFFQLGRRYSYGKRGRLLLLSLRQVRPADAIVPAKAVNVHQSPEQSHDQGSRRKIEAQNAIAPMAQGWRRPFERAEANSRQLHSCGFPAVNQEQVLIARPKKNRHHPCGQQNRFGEGQLRQHLMADQGEDNRGYGHQRAIHQSGTEALREADRAEWQLDVLGGKRGSSSCWLELQSIEKRRGWKRLQLLRDIENARLLRQNGVCQPVNGLCGSRLPREGDNFTLWPGSRLDGW